MPITPALKERDGKSRCLFAGLNEAESHMKGVDRDK
jgi:hypothetical protein